MKTDDRKLNEIIFNELCGENETDDNSELMYDFFRRCAGARMEPQEIVTMQPIKDLAELLKAIDIKFVETITPWNNHGKIDVLNSEGTGAEYSVICNPHSYGYPNYLEIGKIGKKGDVKVQGFLTPEEALDIIKNHKEVRGD